jgi:hypothetical protein
MIVFFQDNCHTASNRSTFGLCDDPPILGEASKPAYIDEANGQNWIATVDNHYCDLIHFYAIDHCVTFPPLADGRSAKRCDGVLTCNDTIAFVELKSRNEGGTKWIDDAEEQVLVAIEHFEHTHPENEFKTKRAYIANNMRPKSRAGQATRIEKFYDETGYVLYIKARIALYSPQG